jgi:hypothetical protein
LLRPTAKRRCNGRAHRSVTTGAALWSVAKFARLVTRASRFVGAANRPDGKHPARTKRSPPTVPSAGCGARDRAWFHSIPRPPIGGRGSDAAVRRGRSAGSDVQPALPLPTLVMKPLGFFLRYLQRLAERREARGEPPAEDIADGAYWLERAKRARRQDTTELKRRRAGSKGQARLSL